MKQVMMLFMMLMMGSVGAQNVFTVNLTFSKEVKEKYLIGLFTTCKLVYCDRDSIADDRWIKKIEVEFFDTTHFFAAYFVSSMFTKDDFMNGIYECVFIQMDDGGEGWDLYEEDLEKLPAFKSFLTQLLQETPFVQYTGPCPGTD